MKTTEGTMKKQIKSWDWEHTVREEIFRHLTNRFNFDSKTHSQIPKQLLVQFWKRIVDRCVRWSANKNRINKYMIRNPHIPSLYKLNTHTQKKNCVPQTRTEALVLPGRGRDGAPLLLGWRAVTVRNTLYAGAFSLAFLPASLLLCPHVLPGWESTTKVEGKKIPHH